MPGVDSRRPPAAMALATAVALSAAGFALAIGVAYGTYSAADTDPYGYVSQADLIASGVLRQELDPASTFHIPDNEAALVPAGYVLAADRRSVVPMYPPGLPLVMALAQWATGDRGAVFYVAPVLAAFAVLTTFLAGVRCAGPTTGTIAAVLLATSPSLLAQTVQPVSDVAATAWWTAAVALILCDAPRWAFLSGLATSLAVLTRPQLVPLAAVIGLVLVVEAWRGDRSRRRRDVRKIGWFLIGILPGCLTIAALNQYQHGSPLVSGYGPLGDLFGAEHVLPNLDRYPRWLVETHTPFVFLGLLAPLVLHRRFGSRVNARGIALLVGCSAVVWLLTLFFGYFPREQWGYVRFLLPAMPALLILSAMVAERLLRAVCGGRQAVATAALIIMTTGVAGWQLREAERRGVFTMHDAERRYRDVGTFIADATPQSAVFVAALHSGSIRYYSGRMSIYHPRLRRGSLDLAVATLQAHGHDVYIALEDGERADFSARFETSAFSRLDWPPAYRTSSGVPVSLWRAQDREAFLAGGPITTGEIGAPATQR